MKAPHRQQIELSDRWVWEDGFYFQTAVYRSETGRHVGSSTTRTCLKQPDGFTSWKLSSFHPRLRWNSCSTHSSSSTPSCLAVKDTSTWPSSSSHWRLRIYGKRVIFVGTRESIARTNFPSLIHVEAARFGSPDESDGLHQKPGRKDLAACANLCGSLLVWFCWPSAAFWPEHQQLLGFNSKKTVTSTGGFFPYLR